MNTKYLSALMVGLSLGATTFAQQSSADPKPADSVAKEAISGVTYQPTAPTAPVVAPATTSIMAAPAPTDAATAAPVVSTELTPAQPTAATAAALPTALPAYKVTEQQQRTQRDVDHAARVEKWLVSTKPAVKTIAVSKNAVLGILAEPKEGAMQKAELPVLDLEW